MRYRAPFFFAKGVLFFPGRVVFQMCFFGDTWCTDMIPSMQVKSRTVTFGNYEIKLYRIPCQAYGYQAFRKHLACRSQVSRAIPTCSF